MPYTVHRRGPRRPTRPRPVPSEPFAGGATAIGRVVHGPRHWTARIVFDDLSKHAVCLPAGLPGAEAAVGPGGVPGRTCSTSTAGFARARGTGRGGEVRERLTDALPVIETQAGDVSAYIPTNVISITDGQDLPGSGPVLPGRSAGDLGRPLGLAGSARRPDQGDEAQVAGQAQGRPRPVPGTGGVRAVRLRPGREGRRPRSDRGRRMH